MRWPSFAGSAGHMFNRVVRVTASSSELVIDGLRMALQPRTSYDSATIAGRFTDATMYGFCQALDGNGAKIRIRKGCQVEEITNGAVSGAWEVTDDPENYDGVYLLVPLRPRRIGR